MGVTSPELGLAVVGKARAFPVLPFLPRKLRRKLAKLVLSLVGAMGASSSPKRHRALTAAAALVTGLVGLGSRVRFIPLSTWLEAWITPVTSVPQANSLAASSHRRSLSSPVFVLGWKMAVGRAARLGQPS